MKVVIDTSVLVAVLNKEPELASFHDFLLQNEPLISSGSMIETQRVVHLAYGDHGLLTLDRLLDAYQIEITAVGPEHVAWARDGTLRFGKGRGEAPAVLNFGDLFAYAAAKALDLPLLFKGEDFARTDVRPARLES